jgi:hypothetical protein
MCTWFEEEVTGTSGSAAHTHVVDEFLSIGGLSFVEAVGRRRQRLSAAADGLPG